MRATAPIVVVLVVASGCAGGAMQPRGISTEDVTLKGQDYTLTVQLMGNGQFCTVSDIRLSDQGGKQRNTSTWTVTITDTANVTIGEIIATCPTVLPNGSGSCNAVQRLTYRCQPVQINARAHVQVMAARLIALATLLLVAVPATADVIELKTGRRVEGTLKQATPVSVSVDVAGQTIAFAGDKVRAIYFGAAPTPKQAGTNQAPRQQPDRFVAWKTMLIRGRTRPTIKNLSVYDSRDECNKFAAHMIESMKDRHNGATR